MEKQIFIVTLYYKTKVWDGISLNMDNNGRSGEKFSQEHKKKLKGYGRQQKEIKKKQVDEEMG